MKPATAAATKSKVLVVFAHPESKSFCAAIKDTAVAALTRAGHEVKISDLYAMKMILPLDKSDFTTLAHPDYFKPQSEQAECNKRAFDGFSDEVKAEHEKVKWCDTLLFIFPLYWWSVPGIMKNWIDRVLSMGFAWGSKGNGSLQPRKGMVLYTTGGPKEFFASVGVEDVTSKQLNLGVFKFCGMSPLEPFVAYQVAWVGDQQRKKYLEEVAAAMEGIDSRGECSFA